MKAAESLGEIGPPAKPALPSLRRLLDDPSPSVQESAQEAIARIDR